MSTLIFIIILLAGYHFLMENIIIPLFRINIQYKLIALQDELIFLKIRNNKEISDYEFNELQNFINTMEANLSNLNYFKLRLLSKRRFSKDENLSKEAEQTINLFTNHKIEEVRRIFEKTMKYSLKGYFINTLGYVIYFLPIIMIFIVFIIMNHGFNKLKTLLYKAFLSNNPKAAKEAVLIIAEEQPRCNDTKSNGSYSTTSINKIRPHLIP